MNESISVAGGPSCVVVPSCRLLVILIMPAVAADACGGGGGRSLSSL